MRTAGRAVKCLPGSGEGMGLRRPGLSLGRLYRGHPLGSYSVHLHVDVSRQISGRTKTAQVD